MTFPNFILPPESEQKVISHPSPDANALSISVKTLPTDKKRAKPTGKITQKTNQSDEPQRTL